MSFYCITTKKNGMTPLFIDDIKNALSNQQGKVGQFFCPASFYDKKLGDAYVDFIGCIWVDVDVPENYNSFEEAVKSWEDKISEKNFVQPSRVVASGAGAHLYWVFNESKTTVKDWITLRDAMVKCFMDWGLKADFAHTHPSAFMRTIGSVSEKTETLVKIVKVGEKVGFNDLLVKVSDYATGGSKSNALVPSNVKLGPKPRWEDIVNHCKAMEYLSRPENQPNVSEAEWRAGLSIAIQCEDGDNIIQEISKFHPQYDPMQTMAKANKTIPYTCQKIKECGGHCDGCENKVKCPLKLFVGVVSELAPKDAKMATTPNGDVGVQLGDFIVSNKGIYTYKQDKVVEVSPIRVDICDVVENTDENNSVAGCYLRWKNSEGYERYSFIDFYIATKENDLLEWLGKHNLSNKIFDTKSFMMYIKQASNIAEKEGLHTGAKTYGWQGDDLIMPFGKVTADGEISRAFLLGDLPKDTYKPTGETKGAFEKMFNYLSEKNNGYLIAPMLISITGPLFPLIGTNPVVTYLSGKSGSGKSTVGLMSSFLYGFKDDNRYNVVEGSSTMNSLIAKMSNMNCLTLMLDEVSLGSRKDEMREIIMQAANGRAKGRLSASANDNTRASFFTPLFITSNATYSGGGEIIDPAQGVRLVELSMRESVKIPIYEINELKGNLVEDGANIAKYIVKNKDALIENINKTIKAIIDDERYDPSMRFLSTTYAIMYGAGLKIIHDLYPSIFNRAIEVMPNLEKRFLWDNRPREATEVLNSALNEWIECNIDKIAVFNSNGLAENFYDEDRKKEIWARYDKKDGIMYIKQKVINMIVQKCNESISAKEEWIKKDFASTELKAIRMTGKSQSTRAYMYIIKKDTTGAL